MFQNYSNIFDANTIDPGSEQVSKVKSLSIDLDSNTVSVEGSEESIIIIAQQVAWLAALTKDGCRLKETRYAYVDVKELPDSTKEPGFAGPLFSVSVYLASPPTEKDSSCWTEILGPSVLITGYPISERRHSERGLEASLQTMASFAGIPVAVTFGGGFVLKGRYHAIVPIKRFQGSVVWHVITSPSNRELEWRDILERCPQRLRHDGSEELVWSARSFFGWSRSVVCDLGEIIPNIFTSTPVCLMLTQLTATTEFDFERFSSSNANRAGDLVGFEVLKIAIGFNKVLTGVIELALRKGRGLPREKRSDDYEWILNRARCLPIIFHGSEDRRAVQSDGEETILHILLHQRRNWTSDDDDNPDATEPLEGACPTRGRTVRAAMKANAERVYRTVTRVEVRGTREALFKQEVASLYNSIDGLRAWLYDDPVPVDNDNKERSSPVTFRFSIGHRQLLGWEYVELIEDTAPKLHEHRVTLDESCGGWCKYARDIKAVPLFVRNLGDVIRPKYPEQLCPGLRELPTGKSYLAVKSAAVSDLFKRQNSLGEQSRLTASGLTIFGRSDIFGECASPNGCGNCPCSRVQMVVTAKKALKFRNHITGLSPPSPDVGPKELPTDSGCIIFGLDPELEKTCRGPRLINRLLNRTSSGAATAEINAESDRTTNASRVPQSTVHVASATNGPGASEAVSLGVDRRSGRGSFGFPGVGKSQIAFPAGVDGTTN